MQKGRGALRNGFGPGRGVLFLALSLVLHALVATRVFETITPTPIGQRQAHQPSGPRPGTAAVQARVLSDGPTPLSRAHQGLVEPLQAPPVPHGGVSPDVNPVVTPLVTPDPMGDGHPAATATATATPAASPPASPISPQATAPPGLPRAPLPTRIPPDFDQVLKVRRGVQVGHGRWTWSVQAGRYHTHLQAHWGQRQEAAAPALNWSSHGALDEHGLAPERFITKPTRGGARAVNFQRDTGRVSYSGPTGQVALVAGAQDRLSWMVQLLALVQAHPQGQGLPPQVPLWVAGPQGDGADWWFSVRWHPDVQCWEFTRRAQRRYEVQVQAWVKAGPTARLIRLEMGPEGGRQPDWLLEDATEPQACSP